MSSNNPVRVKSPFGWQKSPSNFYICFSNQLPKGTKAIFTQKGLTWDNCHQFSGVDSLSKATIYKTVNYTSMPGTQAPSLVPRTAGRMLAWRMNSLPERQSSIGKQEKQPSPETTFRDLVKTMLPFKRVKLGSEPSISQAKAGGLRICLHMAILQGGKELWDPRNLKTNRGLS